MNRHVSPVVSPAARVAVIDYQSLLENLGERDRATIERQRQAHETKFGIASAERWRRLICILRTLATGPMKLSGSSAIQFFIPDGKYRKQVFALQTLAGGAFAVYAPDVLAEAMKAGLLSRQARAGEDHKTYQVVGSDDMLAIDALDARTPSPDDFYKDLTGWNRRAIRITLPTRPSDAQITAARQLCSLAATQWE